MSEPRLCPTCVFFDWDGGEPGYSELTPGSPGWFRCKKGHWLLDENDRVIEARRAMHTAGNCADYTLYKEPKQ